MFGFFKKRKRADGTSPPSPAPAAHGAAEPRMVSFVDAYGRSYRVPLDQWRQDFLKPNLEKKWDDADGLYSLIIDALGDDLAADVEGASVRLLAIDPVAERGFVTRAIVQLRLGQVGDAGTTLSEAIATLGETGTLLTNQAKVFSAEGDQALAMATLDRALQRDPNQNNGLGWRVAELSEASGVDAAQRYLRELTAHPDAWRPHLLLGELAIRAGQHDDGLAWFDQALRRAPHGADVMLAVSGELGKQGLLNDLVQRVAPLFDPRRDDIRVGYNLLQAYADLVDPKAGRALLERLFALGQPAYAQHLQHFAQTFDAMGAHAPTDLPQAPEVSVVQMPLPPWLLGLEGMEWAAPPRGRDRPRVVLLPLAAVDGTHGQVPRKGREDEQGRLSRAVPLFVLEQLIYCSDLPVTLDLPVANGHNLVLFGRAPDDDELDALGQDFDWALEGDIAQVQEGYHVVMRLRRLRDRAIVSRQENRFAEKDIGPGLMALCGQMLAAMAAATATTIEPRVPMYALPGAFVGEYLSGLAQYLALTLAASADARDSLFGERNIYGWLQQLAVSLPDHEPAQFLYLTALAKGRRMHSPIVDEFERPATLRMRELVAAGRYAARLLPLMAAVFPGNAELGELLAAARPVGDDAYAAWCGRVAAAFPVVPEPPADRSRT